jgi:hypothetical protein
MISEIVPVFRRCNSCVSRALIEFTENNEEDKNFPAPELNRVFVASLAPKENGK